MKSLWSSRAEDFDTVMMWAACFTAFFGFFRITVDNQTASNAHCVAVDDIAVDDQDSSVSF